MKLFLPAVLLTGGMFVAGCDSPENNFMAGGQPLVSKPATPVAKVAPPKPTHVPAVPPPKPKPVAAKPAVAATNPSPSATLPTIVTPDNSIAGKVVVYNSAGRFVVLSFPAGAMPKQDQSIFLYRNGLKVGEVKITGPQRDFSIVGDVINGDAQVGDEVRDR